MGYFENLAETAFKTGTNGETHFHRWGVFGKPYIVPDLSQKEETKKFLTHFYQIGLPLGIVGGIFLKWMALPLIPILLLYYEIGIRKRIKGWIRSGEKLTLGQAYSNSSKVFPLAFLWFGAIFSALFVLAGLLIVWKTDKTWQGSLGTFFFGLCLVAYVKMLVMRKRVSTIKNPKGN